MTVVGRPVLKAVIKPLPPKSYTEVYEDDRSKYRYAFTVRHDKTFETHRFKTTDEAERWQKAYKAKGYKLIKQRRKA